MITLDTLARTDLYRVLRRIARSADQATAHEAAAELRLACLTGRLDGMSYGHIEDEGADAGRFMGCALAHLVHAVTPQRMELGEDNQDVIVDVVGYPHAGGALEEYVMYVRKGSRPQDNQYVANLANWLTDYLDNE